jgi:hypothetical protein
MCASGLPVFPRSRESLVHTDGGEPSGRTSCDACPATLGFSDPIPSRGLPGNPQISWLQVILLARCNPSPLLLPHSSAPAMCTMNPARLPRPIIRPDVMLGPMLRAGWAVDSVASCSLSHGSVNEDVTASLWCTMREACVRQRFHIATVEGNVIRLNPSELPGCIAPDCVREHPNLQFNTHTSNAKIKSFEELSLSGLGPILSRERPAAKALINTSSPPCLNPRTFCHRAATHCPLLARYQV